MSYSFDTLIDRRGSGALKTDALGERYGDPDLLPLWVADMDFETPPFIRRRLLEALGTPVLGYRVEHPRWRRAICDWTMRRHGFRLQPEWLAFIPGIVKGIGMAVNFLTVEGDGVIIQPPVYHPFRMTIEAQRRRVVENPLIQGRDGSYSMDFDDLAAKAREARMLILANPHNPGGRVWSADELRRVAEICDREGVIVVSDEIHGDMVHAPARFVPFASVSQQALRNSITFGSPSKTFNIPALATSWASIPDPALRKRFFDSLKGVEFDDPAMLQQEGAVAAYEEGDSWHAEMMRYVEANIAYVLERLEGIPGITAQAPEASFLVWLDCRGLGLPHRRIVDLFVREARLALNDGEMFGQGGSGFMRLNVAAPRATLREAMDRLQSAVGKLGAPGPDGKAKEQEPLTPDDFRSLLRQRVMVLDGAMGTRIQALGLRPEEWAGERFASHPQRLEGFSDILSLTRPDDIRNIHREYVRAGADIISTNTFNSNALSLAPYGLRHLAGELNRKGARLARQAASEAGGRRVLVAGSIGPTAHSASIGPDVSNPLKRDVSFDELKEAYREQVLGLAEGGVDLLLFETAFDPLNLKAALAGADEAMRGLGRLFPAMASLTVQVPGGSMLTGHSPEALLPALGHRDFLVSLGLNCSAGAAETIPALRRLGAKSNLFLSFHPNAGLPDAAGRYSDTPERFAELLRPLLEAGELNIAGGCCGTTPEHIRLLARTVAGTALPRRPKLPDNTLVVSGTERLELPEGSFTVVGERCNVAGSRRFLRLIKERNYEEAIKTAAGQVAKGAAMLDLNLDDPLLDAKAETEAFLHMAAAEPEVARVPIMVDSSDWEVVRAALRCIPGKCVVNSISLKEGEEEFLARAAEILESGNAVVVMAFDEKGQADTFERRVQICSRAYALLRERLDFPAPDIIFDPNVMAVATGMEEHDRYALDFIEATRWIKENLPGARVSGGLSNLSFAFRGNNPLREALHAVFLHHARVAGLDMAIANPGALRPYDSVEPELRSLLDDVVLARRPDASVRLAEWLEEQSAETKPAETKGAPTPPASTPKEGSPSGQTAGESVEERLVRAVAKGDLTSLEPDLREALEAGTPARELIAGPLMEAMERVGDDFGAGRIFLPQVVKAARAMKRAVAFLKPHMKGEAGEKRRGRILIATVKGDVHDIGKNIVSIVLECNGFEVTDLGTMVPKERIVEEARRLRPDFVALSGLITPSLAEMKEVAAALDEAGLEIPLMVGGAATSALHTALHIQPCTKSPVIHARDASQNPLIAARMLDPVSSTSFEREVLEENERLRSQYLMEGHRCLTIEEARKRGRSKPEHPASEPAVGVGRQLRLEATVRDLLPYVNWKMLLHAWRSNADPEGLLAEAKGLLAECGDGPVAVAGVIFQRAASEGDDILFGPLRFPMLRSQVPDAEGRCLSLADFLTERDGEAPDGGLRDHAALFAVRAAGKLAETAQSDPDEWRRLLARTLADRVAEATAEWLHLKVRRELWGNDPDSPAEPSEVLAGRYRGIRPAFGYPALPDQTLIHQAAEALDFNALGIKLTENGAMKPAAAVCGFILADPEARYFRIAAVGEDQLADYTARRKAKASAEPEAIRKALTPFIQPDSDSND